MNSTTKRILIKAKRNIFGELAGNNISSYGGDGFDFFELRPYNYGEDVRKIDWKRSAKMDAPYVKLFHEEREIQVVIVSILSGSLHFGLQRFKQEVVAQIVALVGFSAIKNSDRFAVLECKKDIVKATKITKQSTVLEKCVDSIVTSELLGIETSFSEAVAHIQKFFKRRSLIVFVGDFWEVPNFSILAKKHEVVSLVVRDHFEEAPKALGSLVQADPNTMTRSSILLDEEHVKQRAKINRAHDIQLFNAFLKQNVRATKVYTDDDVFGKLARFLGK